MSQAPSEDIEQAVRRFVSEERGMRIEEIALDATLYGDLSLWGDDVDDFFARFAEQFQVDMNGFCAEAHFPGEGLPMLWPVAVLSRLWRRGTPEEKRGLTPVTVGDLLAAARRGWWTPAGH